MRRSHQRSLESNADKEGGPSAPKDSEDCCNGGASERCAKACGCGDEDEGVEDEESICSKPMRALLFWVVRNGAWFGSPFEGFWVKHLCTQVISSVCRASFVLPTTIK
jgi:hypothetical protein